MALVVLMFTNHPDNATVALEPKQNAIPNFDTGWTRIRLTSRPNPDRLNTSTIAITFPTLVSLADMEQTRISTLQPRMFTSRKPLKTVPLKIRLNSSNMHDKLQEDSLENKIPIQAPVKSLKLIAEVKPTDAEKISALIQKNDSVFVVKNSGKIMILDEDRLEESLVMDVKLPLKKVQFFSTNGWMATIETNSSIISIIDKRMKIHRQLQLSYVPKDMNVFGGKVWVLLFLKLRLRI